MLNFLALIQLCILSKIQLLMNWRRNIFRFSTSYTEKVKFETCSRREKISTFQSTRDDLVIGWWLLMGIISWRIRVKNFEKLNKNFQTKRAGFCSPIDLKKEMMVIMKGLKLFSVLYEVQSIRFECENSNGSKDLRIRLYDNT